MLYILYTFGDKGQVDSIAWDDEHIDVLTLSACRRLGTFEGTEEAVHAHVQAMRDEWGEAERLGTLKNLKDQAEKGLINVLEWDADGYPKRYTSDCGVGGTDEEQDFFGSIDKLKRGVFGND